jgi:glycosyltransferase involved in cell wall biosynthesis
VNWLATIHHGLPRHRCRLNMEGGDYLAFLGRISPEKRPDRAIEIAKRSGVPLKLAAKVDPVDEEYFNSQVAPLLDHPLIEYIGEINDNQKEAFLGQALALVFPIDWPEPFGLVMIEAMAVGTPVIAWRNGSVPEIIEDCLTGFIVDSIDDAVDAVKRARDLDRAAIRQQFESRFAVSRMAKNYLAVYARLLAQAAEETHAADEIDELLLPVTNLVAPPLRVETNRQSKLVRV